MISDDFRHSEESFYEVVRLRGLSLPLPALQLHEEMRHCSTARARLTATGCGQSSSVASAALCADGYSLSCESAEP